MAVNRLMISRLYAKIETTPGTEETIAGTDLCKIYGDAANLFQIDQEFVEIDPIIGTMTNIQQTPGITRATAQFDFLMQGSGAPAAEPYWAKFFQASGCKLTTGTNGSDTEYTIAPSDDLSDHKTLTIHAYHETLKMVGVNMQGGVSLVGEAGRLFRATVNLSGVVGSTPVAGGQSPPAGTLQANRSPKFQKVQLQIGAYTTGTLRRFEFSTGANAVDDLDASATTSEHGLKGRVITTRQPTMRLVLRAEHNLPKDFFSALINGEINDDVSFSLPSVDGQDTITMTFRKPQIRAVRMENGEGLLLYNIEFRPVHDTANQDWELKVATTTAAP